MTWTFEPGGEHLIPDDVAADGFVLAVSGRQGIPKAGQKTREADRALRVAGGPRGASARAAAARDERLWGSVALFAALRAGGLGLAGEAPWASTSLLEVCPAAVWPVWADGRVPDKGLPAGRRMRYDLLRGQGVELPVGCDAMTHDRLDAAAAALTAYLWTTGNTRELGEPPVWDPEAGCLREGFIVTP